MSTTASPPLSHQQRKSAELYHKDIHSWSAEQAAALRRRDFAAVDWDHVTEVID